MRTPGAVILLLLLAAAPAVAGFGMPESSGLYRLPRAQVPQAGRMRVSLLHNYYYQEVGQGSRFHFFQGRAGIGLGLFDVLELGLSGAGWGRYRAASGLDTPLYDAIGGSDWSQGLADGEAWLRLSAPLPLDYVRLGFQGSLRLGLGDTETGLGSGSSDQEWRALASIRLVREPRFVETWLHLSAGRRLNRSPAGWGLAPDLDPEAPWSPWPSYYPPDTAEGDQDQFLAGFGLEFIAEDYSLFGELAFEGYDPALGMTLGENVWQLALGLKGPLPGNFRFLLVFDMNLAVDDFATDFEPHYPRLAHSLALSRDFKLF